jgi:enterochelin esterase-like enzyme
MASASGSSAVIGTLDHHVGLASRFVGPRNVDVWLPPGYDRTGGRRLPTIYAHDGQNLFEPGRAFGGVDWGVGEILSRLIRQGEARQALVVGIWNTEERWREYMPQKPLEWPERSRERTSFVKEQGGPPLSDGYLRFLVEELKPWVDVTYPPLPGRENTYLMGSSMGGLISLYALCEYPHVFGAVACLSTHWLAGDGVMIDYLRRALPAPGVHRIYFDYGTETLDAAYEVWQRQADQIMSAAGYTEGADWLTYKFSGAEHSERAWRERLHFPLRFLLQLPSTEPERK